MSEPITRVPDPDPDEIARRAAEIRQERRDDSIDDHPYASHGGKHPGRLSVRMERAARGASISRWRHHQWEREDL